MSRKFWFSLLLISLLATTYGYAGLTCEVTQSCSYTPLLYLSGTGNAHAQLPSYSQHYNNALCCSASEGIVSTNCGTVFLKLSGVSNAHVQDSNLTGGVYSNSACISVGQTNITCGVYQNSCPQNFVCLVSINPQGNGNTNAHVGSCTTYSQKVCCQMKKNLFFNVTDIDGNAYVDTKVFITQAGYSYTQSNYRLSYDILSETKKTFSYAWGDVDKYDVYIEVPQDFGTMKLQIYNVSTSLGGIINIRVIDGKNYTGSKPENYTVMGNFIAIDPTYITYDNYKVYFPRNSTRYTPNIFLRCIAFNFTTNNCTSWQMKNLTEITYSSESMNKTSVCMPTAATYGYTSDLFQQMYADPSGNFKADFFDDFEMGFNRWGSDGYVVTNLDPDNAFSGTFSLKTYYTGTVGWVRKYIDTYYQPFYTDKTPYISFAYKVMNNTKFHMQMNVQKVWPTYNYIGWVTWNGTLGNEVNVKAPIPGFTADGDWHVTAIAIDKDLENYYGPGNYSINNIRFGSSEAASTSIFWLDDIIISNTKPKGLASSLYSNDFETSTAVSEFNGYAIYSSDGFTGLHSLMIPCTAYPCYINKYFMGGFNASEFPKIRFAYKTTDYGNPAITVMMYREYEGPLEFNLSNSTDWKYVNIDLSNYTTRRIYGLNFIVKNMNTFYLDDLSIRASDLGTCQNCNINYGGVSYNTLYMTTFESGSEGWRYYGGYNNSYYAGLDSAIAFSGRMSMKGSHMLHFMPNDMSVNFNSAQYPYINFAYKSDIPIKVGIGYSSGFVWKEIPGFTADQLWHKASINIAGYGQIYNIMIGSETLFGNFWIDDFTVTSNTPDNCPYKNVRETNWYQYNMFSGPGEGENRPDLMVNASSIQFNNTAPMECSNVTVNITVWNLGEPAAPGSRNVQIRCYENNLTNDKWFANTTELDTIPSVKSAPKNWKNVTCTWLAKRGNHTIIVYVDDYPNSSEPGNLTEDDEDIGDGCTNEDHCNNNANKTISVNSSSLTFSSPEASVWQSTNFTVTIADNSGGCISLDKCYYRVLNGASVTRNWTSRTCSGSFTLTVGAGRDCAEEGDGACTVEIYNNDTYGYLSNTVSRSFNIDFTSPIVSTNYPKTSDVAYVEPGSSININYTYSESRPSNVTLRIYGASTVNQTTITLSTGGSVNRQDTLTIPVGTADGAYNLSITVNDMARNTLSSTQVDAVVVDGTSPTIGYLYPNSTVVGYSRNGSTLNINFSYSEINPKNYSITIYNATGTICKIDTTSSILSGNVQKTTSCSIDNTAAEGMYTLKLVMYDMIPHSAAVTQTNAVQIDNTPPTVADIKVGNIIEVNANKYGKGLIELNATAIDNVGGSGVSYVEYYYNNTFINRSYTSPYTLNWDTRGIPDGLYNVSIKVYDKAGNYKTGW